jgi:carbon-monoxide dehydrogenase small subunit
MTVNGVPYEVDVKPNQTLVHLLREDLGLLGTKCGCEEGECGACTVIMNGRSVTSCLVPAVQADGADILTIEGLSEGEELHPIQEAYVEAGAIQCGFCTPGFVLSTLALLRRHPHPTEEQIREGLAGNLCRCTGYQKIFDAVHLAAEKMARLEV